MPATVEVEMKIPLHCRRLLILVLALFASCRPSKGKEVPPAPPETTVKTTRDAAEEISERRGHFPGWGDDAIRDRKDPESWVERGRWRRSDKDYQGAIADFTKAIELDPKCVSAWTERGEARRNLNDYAGEVSDFTRALELGPKESGAWSNRALARTDVGDNDGAMSDLDKALELDQRNAGAWMYRAIVHVKRRDFEAALVDGNKAIEINPKESGGWYWRGLARHLAGDSSEALKDLNQARGLSGSITYEYILLARWVVRLRLGEKGPNGTVLGTTFNSQPESEEDVWKHALIAFTEGNMTRQDLIARAEAAADVDRPGRICEARFYAGTAALSEGREAEAIADFERSVATGVISYTEYDLAQCELERLKKNH